MPAVPFTTAATDQHQEFDRQVHTLIDRGYPALAGLSPAAFRRLAEPLRTGLHGATPAADGGPVPFVLVVDEQRWDCSTRHWRWACRPAAASRT